jgi:hypothetical protein
MLDLFRDTTPHVTLPPAGEAGVLVLKETSANVMTKALVVAMLLLIAMMTLFYWYMFFLTAVLPDALTSVGFEVVAFLALMSLVFLPKAVTALINPQVLTIDDEGVTLKLEGKAARFSWHDVKSVSIKENQWSVVARAVLGKSMAPMVNTVVAAKNKKMVWDPVFAVEPEVLAGYVREKWEIKRA